MSSVIYLHTYIVNCLDRHVETQPNMVAIIWEQDEPNNHKNITYRYNAIA